MIVLGIDGALGSFSAAVARDGQLLAVRSRAGNVALESGLTLISEVLHDGGVDAAALDRIAVGDGPGGFTGLRITISYAKSLAQAWKHPLVAISSFDLLEYGRALDRVLTVVVGRTGVISARYRDHNIVLRASGPIADVLDQVLPPSEGRVLPVIGAPEDVLAALAERAYSVEAQVPSVTPAAAAAALAGAEREPARSVHDVRADYGELPAAKVPSFSKATR